MTPNTRNGKEMLKPGYIKFSLTWKIAIIFSLVFAVIFLMTLMSISSQVINHADQQIKADLTQVLEGAAAGIDVDVLMELAMEGEPNEQGFSDDPRYTALLDWLDTIHAAEPDAWPYLYIPAEEEGYIYFVVDLYARYDRNAATLFMERYKSNSGYILIGLDKQTYRAVDAPLVSTIRELAESLAEKDNSISSWLSRMMERSADRLESSGFAPKREFGTYQDKYGRWASGYMPLIDSSGEKVAGIGVDFKADLVNQIRTEVRSSVELSFLLSYLFLLPLVVVISIRLTDPIVNLTSTAKSIRISKNHVEFPEPEDKWAIDEIDVLERVLYDTYQKLRNANSQLQDLSRQLISDREQYRKELARDLHDNVLSYLSVISTHQQTEINQNSLEENYKQVIERLRATIFALRSPVMEYGLSIAIEDYIDSFETRLQENQCAISMNIPPAKVRFDTAIETHIFRIVQHALDNAIEHASAATINISGSISNAGVKISIEDDGCGIFDEPDVRIDFEQYKICKKYGVVGMNERAALIGADLTIQTGTNGGTVVLLDWEP